MVNYRRYLRDFLASRGDAVSPAELVALTAEDLLVFSRRRGTRLGRTAWNHLATSLSGFYRWLDLQGHPARHLVGAVPLRRRYRLADVPCALSWEQVQRLLAARLGCRLVASGVAPYRTPGLAAVTPQPRYQELARRYGPVVAEAGTCGCHVHVGVPSRDLGVQVLARLAPLLAVSANSVAGGHDTGWASWRHVLQSRWPTATPPAAWPDAAAYDTAVRRLIARGAALDERSVYFLARLSPRYPTVEVRVADVCLDVGSAVLLAGLTRALVATALAAARRDAAGSAAGPAGRRGAGRRGAAGARRGSSQTRFTGQAAGAPGSAPASWITSIPRSATTATPRRSPGCCAGSTSGGPGPTASGPCSPAPHPRPRSSPHSPARRCPATSRAARRRPRPGSRQRQARSSSVSAMAAICCHGQATRPYTAVILRPGPAAAPPVPTRPSTGTASATCSCTSTESCPPCARQPMTASSAAWRYSRAASRRPTRSWMPTPPSKPRAHLRDSSGAQFLTDDEAAAYGRGRALS